ncbi:cytochrome b5 [Coccomyxa subellipsoidea C-169]|uniref:Cytochrome b5 n=1 Tax=Coccomyxa subellipsoidea (strain C-169) TaxID=574566 RepID=I0Z1Q3_COCSC|nr:cytochrome b5 [Coccomyxa subellipsoidea C-169]EIE24572.1 cytochrome b5 [Coccomyxa subellipsoidea C-169]|eukprot:XP_005649116.1 cytochrome b5 [Coccomyxa subellipsoidea C-169]
MPERSFTLEEVSKHNKKEDAWIVVNGKVYDITAHIMNHPGWECACGISTVLAIMRVLGTDCSEEFDEVHTAGGGKKQLPGFCIGSLKKDDNG